MEGLLGAYGSEGEDEDAEAKIEDEGNLPELECNCLLNSI